MNNMNPAEIASRLKAGAVGMIATDTLYGFHTNAFIPEAVERIYHLKQRDQDKPFIILISTVDDLEKFGIKVSDKVKEKILTLWPGKVSIVFDVDSSELEYLHRGKKSLAFRIPDKTSLRELLDLTGPLVSTTVNIAGEPHINNVEEAQKKFGDQIDFYVDEGEIVSEPSTVMKFNGNQVEVLRQGAVNIETSYTKGMNPKLKLILTAAILVLVGVGVFSNVRQQRAVDQSKIPQDIELSKGFQRWITNLKNKDLEVDADEFRLVEETEVFNTRWLKVAGLNDPSEQQIYENTLKSVQGVKGVAFSPDESEFVDYRNEDRGDVLPTQVRYYGLKGDKVLDANVIDCSSLANCYFDRAYFIDDNTFVVSEFSRNIDKKDTTAPVCKTSEVCTYTIKVHVVNLQTNSRLEYQSRPMELVMDEIKPEL